MRLSSIFVFTLMLGGAGALESPLRSWSQGPVESAPATSLAEGRVLPEAPEPDNQLTAKTVSRSANVSGTVIDTYGDLVPGATVIIESADAADRHRQEANDNGFFEFKNITPGISYRVTVSAKGFDPWVSPPVTLEQGQFFQVTGINLRVHAEVSSVHVVATREQIATEQVTVAEHQRILGIIPNFYVIYDSENAVQLTTKLKFRMAARVAVDPVSFLGAATLGAIYQAGDIPNYQQGWTGYAQRFGAVYADGVSDIMFGGAILPWLLHQDPRYFYLGKGPAKSRLRHALSNPFVCKGDNGHKQVNFSSMGGDLVSGALSNLYYPESNRGASLVFTGFLISTGERLAVSVLQEFVIRRFTPSAKH